MPERQKILNGSIIIPLLSWLKIHAEIQAIAKVLLQD